MSAKPATTEKLGVTLIRDGVGKEVHNLPEGATLADLLREAQAAETPHVTRINGRSIEEYLVLQPDMVVTITPVISGPVTKHSWRETFGMFKDDPHFQEMVDAGRAIREAARKEAEDDEA
jgi:sulfur carrier protein ThiS